ncbi:MAG: SDR family NAD(P)-dependent oxidoreductase [Patescibacteria group bacterium]
MTTLITGASSGIGRELARIAAQNKENLVLVARSTDKLEQLKTELEKEYGITVTCVTRDLAQASAAEELYNETEQAGLQIDTLINSAGFGEFGMFTETNWEKELAMITVNITTLTYLCKCYLPKMIAQKSGRILNIASTAAFQPGPTMAVYYATKAYVLHFSEAINNEVQGTGVTVTALCPGATQSGFQQASHLEESKLVKGRKLPTAGEVAAYGYQAMMQGKSVAVHGLQNKILATAVRFLPRDTVTAITRSVQERAE